MYRVLLVIPRLADGKTSIGSYELSDPELQAYKKHPDTFFGMYKKQDNRANDAIDLYDFFYGAHKKTSKEKLLGFLAGHPRLSEFSKMTQEELAKIYCEGLVYSALNNSIRKRDR